MSRPPAQPSVLRCVRVARRSLAALVVAGLATWAVAGCGGRAFVAHYQRAPSLSVVGAREVWIATDRTDRFSGLVAERLASGLRDLAPTQIVMPGRPPEHGVVLVILSVTRDVSREPGLVSQATWTCDPSGACYTQQVPMVVDRIVVRVEARVRAHAADGTSLGAPRVIDERAGGEDEIGTEALVLGRVRRGLEDLFHSSAEELTLPLLDVEDPRLRSAIEVALAEPTEQACARIEIVAMTQPGDARARGLLAAAQCRRAIAGQGGQIDGAQLRAAERLLVEAMRLSPAEPYAQALGETRAWIDSLGPTPEPNGDNEATDRPPWSLELPIPAPPASYE